MFPTVRHRPRAAVARITRWPLRDEFPLADGMELLVTEWFDETIDSGNTGDLFTSVSGSITGGLEIGCNGRNADGSIHSDRQAGSMDRPTTAEIAAGSPLFEGTVDAALFPNAAPRLLGGVFRFNDRVHMGAKEGVVSTRALIQVTGLQFGGSFNLTVYVDENGVEVSTYDGNFLLDTVTGLSANTPIWIGMLLEFTAGASQTWRAVVCEQGEVPIVLDGTTGWPGTAGSRVIKVRQPLHSAQIGFSGMISGLRVYALDSLTDGEVRPTDLGSFVRSRQTYEINLVSGSDTVLLGPGQSCEWLYQAWRHNVIAATNTPWGNDTFDSLANTAGRRAWAEAQYVWPAEGSKDPEGDLVEVYADETSYRYEVSAMTGSTRLHEIDGLEVAGKDSAYPVFDLNDDYAPTWTEYNAGTHPNVWVSDTPVTPRACLQQVNSDGTGITPYFPARLATTATALDMVKDLIGSFWNEDGTVYVHCLGDENPNNLYWRIWSGRESPFYMTDRWNGRIRQLIIDNGWEYARDASGPDLDASNGIAAHYHIGITFEDTVGSIVHIHSVISQRGGKHAFIVGGNNALKGLAVWSGVTAQAGPLIADGTAGLFSGFNPTDWSPFVDHSNASATGSIVTYYYACVNMPGTISVGGLQDFGDNAGQAAYLTHNGGSSNAQYALTVLHSCEFTGTPTSGLEHADFEII